MKQQMTMEELQVAVAEVDGRKKDYIVDCLKDGGMVMTGTDHGIYGDDFLLHHRIFETPLAVSPQCHAQLASKMGIPMKYYNKMKHEDTGLLAHNVNAWLGKDERPFMVRSLNTAQDKVYGEARAFLSDQYLRVDNADVLHDATVDFEEAGLEVESCGMDEDSMWLKAVNPNKQNAVKVGDAIQWGVQIQSSETGLHRHTASLFVKQLICLNGMAVPHEVAGISRTHISSRLRTNDRVSYNLAETRSPRHAMASRSVIREQSQFIETASGDTSEPMQKIMGSSQRPFYGRIEETSLSIMSSYDLNQGEREKAFSHLVNVDDLTQWGLSASITRTAADVDSYRRAGELEGIGWNVVAMTEGQWQQAQEYEVR
jgi:hypothetical protein